ncbi:MAG: FAD binding domain-containing protein, partial [Steroidobacteraceae bacterium]
VEQAAALLAQSAAGGPVVAKAGGMDLVDLMKERIVKPSRVVNLRTIPGLDAITFDPQGGLALGALATLARIEASPQIRERYPALAQAAGHAATPQVRNAATIGGNLLQRPRCWYFRNESFHSGSVDPLEATRRGENQYHAIFDNARTAMVHSSTPATALIAYGAQVQLVGPNGQQRMVAIKDLLLPPDITRERDTSVQPGEVLTQVVVQPPASGTRAAYHKQTERESYDWPICDVAVALRMNGSRVGSASIVLGWVAPTPRRAEESERMLAGQTVTPALARRAAHAAVAGATPLTHNAYKVPVLETVIRRTILAAAAA